MLVCIAPDNDGLSSPCRVVELFNRGEKGIQIDKKDGFFVPRVKICQAIVGAHG